MHLNVSALTEDYNVSIRDCTGKIVSGWNGLKGNQSLEAHSFQQGVFISSLFNLPANNSLKMARTP
ncbi:MAG: hypothetical protein IPN26_18010 [Bacteroidetes bacterium]|nr:hypothetical protein [Bacteroidota bacterium]